MRKCTVYGIYTYQNRSLNCNGVDPQAKAWQKSTQHTYTFHDHTRTHWINKHRSGSHTCATCQEEMQSLRCWILSNLCSKTTFGAFQPPPCWNGKWMTPWSAEPRRVLRTNGWVLVGPWSRVTRLETEHTHTHTTRVPSINWIFTDQHLHATQAVTEAHQFMPINVYTAIFHPHPATTPHRSIRPQHVARAWSSKVSHGGGGGVRSLLCIQDVQVIWMFPKIVGFSPQIIH